MGRWREAQRRGVVLTSGTEAPYPGPSPSFPEPARRWARPVPFWAPRDEEEGGTWVGVNAHGLIAAITNRSRLPQESGRESRGHLVAGLLVQPDPGSARAWLADELARAPRNPCQLLVLHGADAWVCRVGPEGVAFEDLVFLQNDNEEASFLLALDCESGEQRWRAQRRPPPSRSGGMSSTVPGPAGRDATVASAAGWPLSAGLPPRRSRRGGRCRAWRSWR